MDLSDDSDDEEKVTVHHPLHEAIGLGPFLLCCFLVHLNFGVSSVSQQQIGASQQLNVPFPFEWDKATRQRVTNTVSKHTTDLKARSIASGLDSWISNDGSRKPYSAYFATKDDRKVVAAVSDLREAMRVPEECGLTFAFDAQERNQLDDVIGKLRAHFSRDRCSRHFVTLLGLHDATSEMIGALKGILGEGGRVGAVTDAVSTATGVFVLSGHLPSVEQNQESMSRSDWSEAFQGVWESKGCDAAAAVASRFGIWLSLR
jgi:hypothetical protein